MRNPFRQGDERGSRQLQRLGLIAILFFLAKGLAWLALPALVILRGCDG